MGLKDKVFESPWGLSAISAVISSACGVAILAFGAPVELLVLTAWGLAPIYAMLRSRRDQGLGRR